MGVNINTLVLIEHTSWELTYANKDQSSNIDRNRPALLKSHKKNHIQKPT